jgi:CPA1 family monovalent cation:H+ antiporter
LVVAATALAPKLGVAAPLVLVVFGAAAALLPWVPEVPIDSEWILAGLLPPLLYATAASTPLMEFRRDFGTISIFSVLLVFASAAVIGGIMTLLVPGLNFALGVALGAIIAPTDAVATSIVRKAGASSRIVTVLEGEAMLNDASALVLLRSAVAASATALSFWEVAGDFLYAVVVAVLIGLVVGALNLFVRARLKGESLSVALSLVIPYVAYLPAEHLHASGLVAAVVAGLIYSNGAAKRVAPEIRITEASVWQTVELLLESAIFLLMGMQVVSQFEGQHWASVSGTFWQALWIGVVCATAIIAIRTLFVAVSLWQLSRRTKASPEVLAKLRTLQDRLDAHQPTGNDYHEQRLDKMRTSISRRVADLDYLAEEHFGWKEGFVLVAAGMRGAITLAAAQTLPYSTHQRTLLVTIAFIVATGTLVVQGGLLPWIIKRLGVAEHDAKGTAQIRMEIWGELVDASYQLLNSPALKRSDGTPYSPTVLAITRDRIENAKRFSDLDREQSFEARGEIRELRVRLLDAERQELLRIRNQGHYPSELLNLVLQEIDVEQYGAELSASEDSDS